MFANSSTVPNRPIGRPRLLARAARNSSKLLLGSLGVAPRPLLTNDHARHQRVDKDVVKPRLRSQHLPQRHPGGAHYGSRRTAGPGAFTPMSSTLYCDPSAAPSFPKRPDPQGGSRQIP